MNTKLLDSIFKLHSHKILIYIKPSFMKEQNLVCGHFVKQITSLCKITSPDALSTIGPVNLSRTDGKIESDCALAIGGQHTEQLQYVCMCQGEDDIANHVVNSVFSSTINSL